MRIRHKVPQHTEMSWALLKQRNDYKLTRQDRVLLGKFWAEKRKERR